MLSFQRDGPSTARRKVACVGQSGESPFDGRYTSERAAAFSSSAELRRQPLLSMTATITATTMRLTSIGLTQSRGSLPAAGGGGGRFGPAEGI